MNELKVGNAILEIQEGDITKLAVDAVVNAANTRLAGGGGVDGAIHRAAGPVLYEETERIIGRQGRVRVGDAVTTGAGNMPAKFVIHTVGPFYSGGTRNEEGQLKSAYQSSLREADRVGAKSVAFPAISTGAYGYPLDKAADIAVNAVIDYLHASPKSTVARVVFVQFGRDAYDRYLRLFESLDRLSINRP
jgi:O-acetyl-ADP-ribose deacetylase (regulator of RNase III)